MHEIELHEHGEEGFGSNVGNQTIHTMCIDLIETYCLAVNILFYEYFISGLVRLREGDIFIDNDCIEFVNVPSLLREVQLLSNYFFERVGGDWDLKLFGEDREE